jgi:16S rRNA (guanine527-N7)-methyltransferase
MDPATQILESAKALDLSLSRDAARSMARHLDLLSVANSQFNLTTIPMQDWAWAHVLDSLSCVPEMKCAKSGRFADLGSGGGFPGIPLALATGREVMLVESVKKKAAFLAETLGALGIKGGVEPVRAEELAKREAGAFAVVTVRAVSSLASLVELASPLLEPGGRLICLKGEPRAEEVESGLGAARICGLSPVSSRCLRLPMADVRRTIIVYEKNRTSRVPLPRRPGMAQRQPLA